MSAPRTMAASPPAPGRSLADLNARHGHLRGRDLLEVAIGDIFPGRIALSSSFGADAAVLLAMVAEIEPATPVIFLDTGKLFAETQRYAAELAVKLGLTDLRHIHPDPKRLVRWDAVGDLWKSDPDSCCDIRKVKPLAGALEGFEAWITGRKRFQGATRAHLPAIEEGDGRIKFNPLIDWTEAEIRAEFHRRGLPRHPLVAAGFRSIGCLPCTRRVGAGEDSRSGRWAGTDKIECGIHSSGSLSS